MKTLINFCILLAVTFQLHACGSSLIEINKNYYSKEDPYSTKMQEALNLWKQNKISEAAGLFERIAIKEKENWLPYYYTALVYATNSFDNPDKKQVAINLKKAQNHLNEAEIFTDNTVEVKVLQAMILLGEMMLDPQNKSQTLAPKIEKLYMEAVTIAPKNPRAVAGLADWKMGEAKWFGRDTTPYCQAFEKALALFENDAPKETFGPTWGKDRVLSVLNECSNTK